MIHLTEPLIDIAMKIEIDLPQWQILEFLNKKGYSVEAYRQVIPATDEMLVSEPEIINHTFVALKKDEPPNDNAIYLKVFEREIKTLLNKL